MWKGAWGWNDYVPNTTRGSGMDTVPLSVDELKIQGVNDEGGSDNASLDAAAATTVDQEVAPAEGVKDAPCGETEVLLRGLSDTVRDHVQKEVALAADPSAQLRVVMGNVGLQQHSSPLSLSERLTAMQIRMVTVSDDNPTRLSLDTGVFVRNGDGRTLIRNATRRLRGYCSDIEKSDMELMAEKVIQETIVVTDPPNWDVKATCRWLSAQGWAVYTQGFEACAVDGAALLQMPRQSDFDELLFGLGVVSKLDQRAMKKEIISLDCRWGAAGELGSQIDFVLYLQRWFRRKILSMRHSQRLGVVALRRQAISNYKENSAERYTYVRKYTPPARIIQGGIRGYVTRRDLYPMVLMETRREAMRQRQLEAQRLTEEEAQQRQLLVDHREEIRLRRLAEGERQQLQINKLAFKWATAEAQTISDQQLQEAMRLRMEGLKKEIEEAEAKQESEKELREKLKAEKMAELVLDQAVQDSILDEDNKEAEIAKFGNIAHIVTEDLKTEIETGMRVSGIQIVEEDRMPSATKKVSPETKGEETKESLIDQLPELPKINFPSFWGFTAAKNEDRADDKTLEKEQTEEIKIVSLNTAKESGYAGASRKTARQEAAEIDFGETGKTTLELELEAELRKANAQISQLQSNIDVAQSVISDMDAAKTPMASVREMEAVNSFDELLTRLRTQSQAKASLKKAWVEQACETQKSSYASAVEVLNHFKGRDLQDVGVALYSTMQPKEFDDMIKTIRPQLFQRKILARI